MDHERTDDHTLITIQATGFVCSPSS